MNLEQILWWECPGAVVLFEGRSVEMLRAHVLPYYDLPRDWAYLSCPGCKQFKDVYAVWGGA